MDDKKAADKLKCIILSSKLVPVRFNRALALLPGHPPFDHSFFQFNSSSNSPASV